MELMNPTAAQESNHNSVKIICTASTEQYSFVSHLSAALRREGISVFVDAHARPYQDTGSLSGDQTVYVVVSSNVVEANDPWSHKFIEVVERRRDNGATGMVRIMSPVPYNVEPFSRVYGLADRWEEAGNITTHQSRISSNKILTDSQLVEEIVQDVYGRLYPERLGVYSRILEIENLLYKQLGNVRTLGIWGVPGICKTTLAKAVFNHMSTDYDSSCFIENFDGAFHKEGLHRLLDEKIGKILKEEFDIKSSYIMRPSLHRDKLCHKRILLVLDDVRDALAAESFLGKLDWFGLGSLIIITSIDKQVFAFCQINQIYEVQGLKEHEARCLFSQNAFGKDIAADQNDIELSRKVIDYANGNPLALSIYGQELKGKMSEVEAVFLNLKQHPPQKIKEVLKNVYSALGDNEKNIFLDIAFFFKGENVNYVAQMLEGCRYLPRVGIDVLVDKCVLTISENTVQINNLIQDICQEISNGEIENCTSMWEPYSIRYLLEDDDFKARGQSSATPKCGLVVEDIESILLDTYNLKFDVRHDAFKNMFNLKFLKIYSSCSKYVHGLNFPMGLDSLPCGLRLLHWENYPLQSLPQDFDLDNLVELCMPHSQLQTLGVGTKNLKMLRSVNLCHSQQLVEFDILSVARNIELIDLQGCTRLQSFPDTSELQHLRVLNLSCCTEIKSFQGAPPNIEELHLQGTSIREIPISIVSHSPQRVKLDRRKLLNLLENFQDVEHIDLESVTNLVKVGSYSQGFGKLVHLNMKDCSHLRSLPDMVNLESLQVLLLSGCSELEEIKGFPRNMRKLYLGGTAVRDVPQFPQCLEFLNAHGCKYLEAVHLDFEQLPRQYIFSNCYNFSPQVIADFLEEGLTRVASLAKAKHQGIIKTPQVSICIPIGARQKSYCLLQAGPSAMIDLDPWKKVISGFAMSVVVSFQDDYHNTVGLGIRCTCTWKRSWNGYSEKIERLFQCWAPTEAPKVEWDHMFIFYDTEAMHPNGSEENPNLWADEVHFEFHTVSWENKLLSTANCTVTLCGVEIITTRANDTRPSEITRESEVTSIIEDHPPTPDTKMADELTTRTRFYPTEEELIAFYLRNQLDGRSDVSMHRVIPVLDVFEVEPIHLPNAAGERCRGDAEQWFFFVPRKEREARGGRPRRTTGSGYWKATGSPVAVFSKDNRTIGVKKTMVFYTGKVPTGRKTKWKMNEYKAVDETVSVSTIPKLRHEFSLCRVYIRSGSSRALDRSPVGVFQTERILTGDVAVPESSFRVESSPETSISGGKPAHSSVSYTEMDDDGLTEPIWEWEN